LVKLDHVRAGNVQPLTELMPVLREAGMAAVSPTGVLGDPTGASATLGEQILAAWTADLVSSVRREWELALR
jgi:creatinine amidohydrolase